MRRAKRRGKETMLTMPVKVPDGKRGSWSVESFTITEADARFSNIRAIFKGSLEAVDAGDYKRLVRNGTVVMSNTRMEVITNRPILRNARGHVLINPPSRCLTTGPDTIMAAPEVVAGRCTPVLLGVT